jgi:hypothetical protein
MTMHPIPRRGGENNARELLRSLGMGDYNATIAIQYMFLAPAATDPMMPSIILMTKHLQQGMRAAGATRVAVTGRIDEPTARVLEGLAGPDWNHVTWYGLFGLVLSAARARTLEDLSDQNPVDLGLIPDLPDVPGGMFTILAAAGAAYYFLVYKKRH